MPVRARVNRLIEPSGRIARNRAGTPLGGGGERSRAAAVRHARAINLSELHRRGRRRRVTRRRARR